MSRLLPLGLVALLAAPARAEPPATAPGEKVYVGIEIGGRGVKAVVIRYVELRDEKDQSVALKFTKPPKELKHKVEAGAKAAVNSAIADLETVDGKSVYGAENIARTAAAVAALVKGIRDDKELPVIHGWAVVTSSGVPDATNREVLDEAVSGVMPGKEKLTRMPQHLEVAAEIDGLLDAARQKDSVLIDIGSGNMKFGCFDDDTGLKNTRFINAPRVTGYPGLIPLTARVSDATGDDPHDVFGRRAAAECKKLSPGLRRAVTNCPSLQNSKQVYLSGGIVWAVATVLHPTQCEAEFVLLDMDKVRALADATREKADAFPSLKAIRAGMTPGEWERYGTAVEDEERKVRKVFPVKELTVGLQLLATLDTEWKLSAAGRQVYFPRNAQHAWIFDFARKQAVKANAGK